MLYTSGHELLTREKLRLIPVPNRENVGKNWQGVQHGELADAIIDYAKKLRIDVVKELWYTNPTETALYGAVDFNMEKEGFLLDALGQDANFSLGVRHDNAGKFAVSFAVGARVAVCSNGVFSGEFVLKNKHLKSFSLQDSVAEGFERYLTETDELLRFCRLMRECEIEDKDASYIILQAAERLPQNPYGCVNFGHLRDVYELWQAPTHAEFAMRNLWSLYNCFTQMAKKLTPPRQMGLLKGLRPMMAQFSEHGYISLEESSVAEVAALN